MIVFTIINLIKVLFLKTWVQTTFNNVKIKSDSRL